MSTMVGVEQTGESQIAFLLTYASAEHKQAITEAYLTGIVTRVDCYSRALRTMVANDRAAADKLAESTSGRLDFDSYREGYHRGCEQAYLDQAKWLEQLQRDLLAVLGRSEKAL